MPLTALELPIDQNIPGWLARASRKATDLLAGQGRPQMAAALAAAFSKTPELATLQTYLRTRLTPGTAPALRLSAPNGLFGPLAGGNTSYGRVPRSPVVIPAEETLTNPDAWALGGDGQLITCRFLPESSAYALCCADGGAAEPWSVVSKAPWLDAAHDGERLVTILPGERDTVDLCLHEMQTGELLWRADAALAIPSVSDPRVRTAVADGIVVALASKGGRLRAFCAETGEPLWEKMTLGDINPILRLTGGYLCAILGHGVYIYELATGELVHAAPQLGADVANFWGGAGRLFIGYRKGCTVCLELPRRKQYVIPRALSHTPGADVPIFSGSLAATDQVAVLAQGDQICATCLQGREHRTLWQRQMARAARGQALFIIGDAVVRAAEGRLSAYRLDSGAPLWEDLKLCSGEEGPGGLALGPGERIVRVWGHAKGLLVYTSEPRLFSVQQGPGEEKPPWP